MCRQGMHSHGKESDEDMLTRLPNHLQCSFASDGTAMVDWNLDLDHAAWHHSDRGSVPHAVHQEGLHLSKEQRQEIDDSGSDKVVPRQICQ